MRNVLTCTGVTLFTLSYYRFFSDSGTMEISRIINFIVRYHRIVSKLYAFRHIVTMSSVLRASLKVRVIRTAICTKVDWEAGYPMHDHYKTSFRRSVKGLTEQRPERPPGDFVPHGPTLEGEERGKRKRTRSERGTR